jgi:hypothetical protein
MPELYCKKRRESPRLDPLFSSKTKAVHRASVATTRDVAQLGLNNLESRRRFREERNGPIRNATMPRESATLGIESAWTAA